MSLTQYRRFLPDQPLLAELAAWVAEYVGMELDWDTNLVLKQEEVPPASLDGGCRLGFDTWLGKPSEDAKDLLLDRHHVVTQPLTTPN